MVLTSHFVCAKFCSFAMKKHLFDCGRELEQLCFIEKVFLCITFLSPPAKWVGACFGRKLPQLPKGVKASPAGILFSGHRWGF